MRDRRITIKIGAEPFGDGWEVIVLPTPVGVGHDRCFRNMHEARRYARRLAAATGWLIRDLCGVE